MAEERPDMKPEVTRALNKALDAARVLHKLEEDPHPGLMTWRDAWKSSAMAFNDTLDEYARMPQRNPIADAPTDGTRILAWDKDDDMPYIVWWTDDVYKEQNGSGGPAGWFSGRYRDNYGDYPEFENPTHFRLTTTL